MTIEGKDLRVGDCIEVWWQPRRDIITKLEPYTGSLASLFSEGAQIASFAMNKTGMTIENDGLFEVLARGAVMP